MAITPRIAPSSRWKSVARLPGKRATLFHLEDGAIRGVIAINTPRELKLSRKWMNQGRTIDLATLTDASTALA